MITIKNTAVVRTEKTVEVIVEHEEIPYRFRAVMSENEDGKKYVYEIHFVDKYEVKLKNSLKKKMRNAIKEYFEKETK
jgi:hypothetical protein